MAGGEELTGLRLLHAEALFRVQWRLRRVAACARVGEEAEAATPHRLSSLAERKHPLDRMRTRRRHEGTVARTARTIQLAL